MLYRWGFLGSAAIHFWQRAVKVLGSSVLDRRLVSSCQAPALDGSATRAASSLVAAPWVSLASSSLVASAIRADALAASPAAGPPPLDTIASVTARCGTNRHWSGSSPAFVMTILSIV